MDNDNLMQIRCKHCGAANTLPNLHCKQCGQPLDYEESERRLVEASRPRRPVTFWVKNAVGLLLVLAIVLALWPADLPRDTSGERIDGLRYTMQGQILVDALNRNVQTNLVIAERDINAFFQYQVRAADSGTSGMKARFQGAGVRFAPDAGTAWIRVERGPLALSSEFRFAAGPGGIRLLGAQVGHLPLPGPLGKLYAACQSDLFAKFQNESRILRHLESAELRDGELSLTTALRDN